MQSGKGSDRSLPTFTEEPLGRDRCLALPRRHRPTRTSRCWIGPPAVHITQTTEARHPAMPGISAPQNSPSVRVDRLPVSNGASTTSSLSLHLYPSFACGHAPSDGSGTPLRCQRCSQPHPQLGGRPALSFNWSPQRPAAESFHLRTVLQRLVAHAMSPPTMNTREEENRSANNAVKECGRRVSHASPTVETTSRTEPEMVGYFRPTVRH